MPSDAALCAAGGGQKIAAGTADLGGGAGNQAPGRPAGRLLRLPDAAGKSDRAVYRQC